jgi:hypothetical protein
MAMAREWEVMFEWITSAQRWVPDSVEKFTPGVKYEMEQKLEAADARAGEIGYTLADFRAKIAAVRAVVEAANVVPERIAPIAPIRVAEKEAEAVKDDGEVLESRSIEGRFGDMHLIEIRRMQNGGIEEWVDGNSSKRIYDYEEQKAAKALQAATEATALLKKQNERREQEARDSERYKKWEEEINEAAKAKEARDVESKKNRSYGDYNLLMDDGSRQDNDYSAVREQEARVHERYKKWEEEIDERARQEKNSERVRLAAKVATRAEDIERRERRDRENKEREGAYAERLRTETDEERKNRVIEEDEQYKRIVDAGRFGRG